MPTDTAILKPVFALMVLTFFVGGRLLFVRTRGLLSGKVPMGYYKDMVGNAPPDLIANAKNFSNLLEMPTVFYALIILLFVTHMSDALYLALAWAYVGLRAAHSLVHMTFNAVPARTTVYVLSNLALMAVCARFAAQLW